MLIVIIQISNVSIERVNRPENNDNDNKYANLMDSMYAYETRVEKNKNNKIEKSEIKLLRTEFR